MSIEYDNRNSIRKTMGIPINPLNEHREIKDMSEDAHEVRTFKDDPMFPAKDELEDAEERQVNLGPEDMPSNQEILDAAERMLSLEICNHIYGYFIHDSYTPPGEAESITFSDVDYVKEMTHPASPSYIQYNYCPKCGLQLTES